MEKCQKIIKSEFAPGICAICKSDDNELKNIEHNYLFNHSVENYGDMLLKCFSIQVFKKIYICLNYWLVQFCCNDCLLYYNKAIF